MNPTPDNRLSRGAAPAPAAVPAVLDETLHLITHPPVPAGLEERVRASLMDAAPPLEAASPRARILGWPAALQPSGLWAGSGWMRAAAAAAIVFVVAGGGWGVYQRVQRPTAKVIVMPAAQPAISGAFSSAGAMRTPQTVKGPVVKGSVVKGSVAKGPVLVQPAAKASRLKARKKPRPAAAAPMSGATAQTISAPTAVAAGK